MRRKLLILSCALIHSGVEAVIPTGILEFQVPAEKPQTGELLCSPSINAGWGVLLPAMQKSQWKPIHMAPTLQMTQAYGCEPYTLPSLASPMEGMVDSYKTLVMVDRGNCSFLQKTRLAEQAGAHGVIIRGTKQAVYESIISNNASNTSDRPAFEYSCEHGESFVSKLADPVWSTDDPACHTNPQCASQLCVLTGRIDSLRNHQVCCLWDTHILMGANRTQAKNVSIPVVYVTIADGIQLEHSLIQSPDLLIRMYARSVPFLDVSSLLLWVLGVATALGAAYYSASNDRDRYRQRTDPTYARKQQINNTEDAHTDEHDPFELDTSHAIGFIVCAGIFLILLYYVKAAKLIPILFAFSATATVAQLIMAPLLYKYVPILASRQIKLPFMNETIPLVDAVGVILSGSLALIWYIYRRSCWVLQDFFGIVICFIFLRTLQLPNVKVATVLLTLAFVYDVFFVFISPLVFGSSVMEDVATGGPAAYTRSDYPGIDYCERYPDYKPCINPEPMPMLLTLPRIMDWMGGMSMLGLGDIILPGLLLSFAVRFDYSPQCSQHQNYFRSVAIGYAVGLGMANLAVSIMQIGQPALMYLVPTCLGTLLLRAYRNKDLNSMWLGIGMHDADPDKRYEDDRGGVENGLKPGVVVNDTSHDHAPLLGNVGDVNVSLSR